MTRPLALLLAGSLLVNLFAAGAIGGGLFMLSRPGGSRLHAGGALHPFAVGAPLLPESERAPYVQAMRHVVQGSRDLLRTARESRELAASLFVQPQFDQLAVSAALDRARDADFALRTRLEQAAVTYAATLPLDARANLARALARGPLRHPGGRRAR